MTDQSRLRQTLRPALRLGLVFLIVSFYHQLSGTWFSGTRQLLTVIVLSFLTWILVAKFLFEPAVELLGI